MYTTYNRKHILSRRMLILGLGQAGLFGTLLGRLYYLQVMEREHYKLLSDRNRLNTRFLAPPRGRILDRSNIPLAINVPNFIVQIIAEQTKNLDKTLDNLARLIPITEYDRQRICRDIERQRRFLPVTIREHLTWEEMARIQVNTPDLDGIVIEQGLTRHYPLYELGAHVLGYVAAASEEDRNGGHFLEIPGFHVGKVGIEQIHDPILRGQEGTYTVEVNSSGRFVKEEGRHEGAPGSDIRLTLDANLQQFAARRLGTESAATVVMNILTGEVLVLASTPSFDPNLFSRGLSNAEWIELTTHKRLPLVNKAVSGQYAPGSTFKIIVALAALEAGVVTPDTRVFCPGHLSLGKTRFHCWKRSGHGRVNMLLGLQYSCDVYFYEIARRINIDRIADTARKFGFGSKLGLDLPGEKGGLMPDRNWKMRTTNEPWNLGETLVAGIGQGFVLATPLQLCTMVARIANGQFQVLPRLSFSQIANQEKKFEPLGIQKKNIDIIRKGMYAVSNTPSGTAYNARLDLPGLAMSGKTGTSQVRRITMNERARGVRKNEDLPWNQRDHALFVAYAPEIEPRYSVAVIVEHGGSGSRVAAPIARDIMRELLTQNSIAAQEELPDIDSQDHD